LIMWHVDYQPSSRKEWSEFKALIVNEIKLRLGDKSQRARLRAILSRPFEDQRRALKELVECENSILIAVSTVHRHETARNLAVALAVEKLIPCILHMKMRLGEKIFQVIVNMGLERYEDGLLDATTRKQFVADLKSVVNKQVLGNESMGREAQWSFNWAPGNRRMAKYGMSGPIATKMIKGLSAIAKTVFASHLDQEPKNEEDANQIRQQNYNLLASWELLSNNLLRMWDMIERKEDFAEKDLLVLHKYTGTFMHQWVDLCNGKHMTNYIHVLGAGHLTYAARHYGNLYRFSQQGWESLNKLIKHFYYNNTNHGGSYGNGGKDENGKYTKGSISGQHCYPLMRFCQRFMMWKLGYGDTYFQSVTNGVLCETNSDKCMASSVPVDDTNTNDDMQEIQFGII
jgi:hypothetical protein